MSDISKDLHWPWLGFALEEGLKRSLLDAESLFTHVTPEALVAQLPHELTIQVLSRALTTGTLSPVSVLETVPPAALAEHLESEILWRCLSDTGARAGLSVKGGSRSEEGRRWLGAILQKALDASMITAADLLRFVPPAEFVKDTPLDVMASLIRNGLTRKNFDPAMVLQHLTPAVIAENIESSLVWACLADGVRRHFAFDAGSEDDRTGPVKMPSPMMEKVASEKPVIERAAAEKLDKGDKIDKTVKPKPRIEPVLARKPSPPAPLLDGPEWPPTDDLDVVEEQPLPPPPAALRKA